jgi:hypothetical protein
MYTSLSVAAVTEIDESPMLQCSMQTTKMRFDAPLKKWSEVQVTSASRFSWLLDAARGATSINHARSVQEKIVL